MAIINNLNPSNHSDKKQLNVQKGTCNSKMIIHNFLPSFITHSQHAFNLKQT